MNRRDFFVCAGASLAGFVVTGCSLDSSNEDNDGRRRRRRRLEEDDDYDRDRDRARDDRDRWPDQIPRSAKRIERDVNRPFYEAGNEGRVFLYDENDDRVVFSESLRKGERFVADPKENRMTIDGKRVGDVNLRAGHEYTVYFDRK